ncbi:2-dehydropantoate 2-reductase [Alteromonas flava]|uniref:2-dehydropantoate 2-reductase n=1 Tax=Alteromonas flava TaxID=2048003 RepID=UPI000C2869FE|nr:2-dehydropantoate 2-reductase [Alteromonas flava]
MTSQLVFGAGLIGCYLGGCLSLVARKQKKPHTVYLYCRQRMGQALQQGMVLTDYQENRAELSDVSVITELTSNCTEPVDIIWLTVKCTAINQAISDMAPFVGPKTVILCCQNGLGVDHLLRKAYPHNEVLRVMVPFNVVTLADGHFHRGSQGSLTLESSAYDERLTRLLCAPDDISSNQGKGLLPIAFTADMTAVQWAKLQLNLGNSVNALANVPVKAMLEQREFRRIIAAMMEELLLVTNALGLKLPKVASVEGRFIPFILRLPNWLFKRVANKMLAIDPTVKTSMWWDLHSGKKTEVDFLNGAVLAQAEQLGLVCPVNEKIVEMIHDAEASATINLTISATELSQKVGIK